MQEGNSYTNSDSSKMSIETTFQLKRSGVSSAYVSVEVDFSPVVSDQSTNQHDSSQKTPAGSVPIFNKDNNFFTPSFILQMDKNKYVQNQHLYQSLFEKKVEEMDQQKSQMFLPRPSKANSFCCVCKSFFEDYLTHVNLPMHRTLMEKSEFHKFIQDVCSKFAELKSEPIQKKKAAKIVKTKIVKKTQKPKRLHKSIVSSPSTRIQCSQFMGEDVKIC